MENYYGPLFCHMMQLSALTLGGGFVIVPLMRKRFVEELHWLTEEEMLDAVAMAQSTPGATSINVAVMVGHRRAGLPGAVCAATGALLPPLVIMCTVSMVYDTFMQYPALQAMLKSMRSVVAAMIATSVISMGRALFEKQKWKGLFITLLCFMIMRFISSVWVLITCAILGIIAGRVKQCD